MFQTRGVEAVNRYPAGVQTISDGGVVRFWKGSKVLERGGTGTGLQRIDVAADECWIECLHVPAGAPVQDESIAHRSRRNSAHRAALAGVPAPFVIEEVEDTILLDGTADRSSEHVADELRTIDARPVVEEIIRRRDRVTVELVE